MATRYRAKVGMNLPPDDARYEAGDEIPESALGAATAASWVEQGLLESLSAPVSAPSKPSRGSMGGTKKASQIDAEDASEESPETDEILTETEDK